MLVCHEGQKVYADRMQPLRRGPTEIAGCAVL
jgi:hypothetical protein